MLFCQFITFQKERNSPRQPENPSDYFIPRVIATTSLHGLPSQSATVDCRHNLAELAVDKMMKKEHFRDTMSCINLYKQIKNVRKKRTNIYKYGEEKKIYTLRNTKHEDVDSAKKMPLLGHLNEKARNQRCGSLKFWYGPGCVSSVPYFWLTDPGGQKTYGFRTLVIYIILQR